MAKGFNGFETSPGTPGSKFSGDFVINNTISEQRKFGGIGGSVTIAAENVTSLNGKTFTFYDASNTLVSATCDNSVSMDDSTATVIGVSDTNTVVKLATSINNFLNVAATQEVAEFTATRDSDEVTITRTTINNGAVTLTSEEVGGTLLSGGKITIVGTNSLLGTVPNEQVPFCLNVKGPPTLRQNPNEAGNIPYVVSSGGPALDLVEATE